MEIERARYLVSADGREALANATTLAGLTVNERSKRLRKVLAPEFAAAIGEQLELRERAREKLADPSAWLFTARGLEMMTHPLVAARRAERVRGFELPVADLTCGIGSDLLSLIEAGIDAIGVDRDPVAAILARHNAQASIAVADAVRPPLALAGCAVLIDPSRRSEARRVFDPAAFEPPWDAALEIARSAKAAVIKAPPGIPHELIPDGAEVEFVQVGRSLREAALWFGHSATPGTRRAVLLPSGATLDSTMPYVEPETVEPRDYVIDPESCVTRAGLVRQLGHTLGARMLDSQVAYLTAGQPAWSPLAATFAVLEIVPFSVSRLRTQLRAGHWRPDEIRRRAFPIEPDELRRLLGRFEGDPVTLLCTTISGRRVVFIARRV